MITFTEILACQGTAVYYTQSQGLHFHRSAYDGMVLLRLDDWEYGVNPSGQIQYQTSDPQFQMVFHMRRYPKGKWVLKINEHTDEVFSCLNQKSYLKQKNKAKKYGSFSSSANQQQKKEVSVKNTTKLSKQNSKRQSLKRSKLEEEFEDDEDVQVKKGNKVTVGSVFVGASKGLGWGLSWTGKMIAKGVQGVGGMVSKNVKPNEQKVKVSAATKANLQLAKNTTKNVFQFTSKQVGNLFNFGKEVASDIGDRFQKSEKGQQLQNSPKYQMAKSGAATGVKVLSNIYDGAVNAVYEIGSGISKGTSKVVEAKYGDQAGQAANDVFQGAGNVVKIARVPTDQTYKAFKD